jgi:hypothetical protein
MSKVADPILVLTPRQVAARVRHKVLNRFVTGGRLECANCNSDLGKPVSDVLQYQSGAREYCPSCDGDAIVKPNFYAAGFAIDLANGMKNPPALLLRKGKVVPGSKIPVAKKTAKLTDHIVFVIDDSGSMQGKERALVDMFNLQLDTIKKDAASNGRKTLLSMYYFSTAVQRRIDTIDINQLNPMQHGDYRPVGRSTAIRDAFGGTIAELKAKAHANDPNTSFIMFFLTDGEDTEPAQTYNTSTVQAMIKAAQATDRWTIGVLGPPGSTHNIVRFTGIDAGNVREWEGTSQGLARAAVATQSAYAVYSTARTAGRKSVRTALFEADLSKVKASDLNRNFDDVSTNFKKWNVEKECVIKDFVESHGVSYSIGSAYYELTKKETVQDYKQICIMNKKTGVIYSGTANDLRGLLNIPVGQTIKFEPGNMATFRLFIQSTSVNRILVRGTTLLYRK